MKVFGKPVARDFFGNLVPVMEADDLTKETATMMKQSASSKPNANTEPNAPTPPAENPADQNQDPNQNPAQPGGEAPPQEEPNQDQGGNDPYADMGGGDPSQDGLPPDDGTGGDMGGDGFGESEMTKEQAKSIMKLQADLNQFYQVICNTIESLSEYSAPITTEDLQQVLGAAMQHLSSTRTLLLDLLKSDFTTDNYADKLKKYIALRHVYSIVLDMLNLHFDAMELEAKSRS